jgi:hypothetical protein
MIVLTSEEEYDTLQKDNDIKGKSNERKGLWKTIAKNEIRIRTSKFRNNRVLFFIVLYSLLFLWAFLGAPIIFDIFMPTLASQYSGIFTPMVAIIIESLMMSLFLVLMMYPLNTVYREGEIGNKESILATPVRANDIFIGEFLGKAPIYSMAVLILAPIIVGLVNPIIDLTIIQYIIIYACVFGMVYFANLIGSILASLIEHKMTKSEKARDLGKALIWIFTIALVAVMYSVLFFLNEILTHPELKNWLAFYPSFWFSNIILYSIETSLLNSFILNIGLNIILAIGIPLLTLILAYAKAGNFYSLEGILEIKSTTITSQENIGYKFFRKIYGRKWGGLVVIQLKRFLRKKANYARLAYVYGLIGFMTWFMSGMTDDEFIILLTSTILIAIGGAVSSIMIGHLAFVDSKDLIWVYKRSPRGIKGLVYSYLMMMFIFNVFLATFATIFYSILGNIDLMNAVIMFAEFLIIAQFMSCQAMGLQCISPAFGEKDPNMRGNAMISMLLMQPILFLPIALLILVKPQNIQMMRLIMQGPLFLYIIATSVGLLTYGMKKIKKME